MQTNRTLASLILFAACACTSGLAEGPPSSCSSPERRVVVEERVPDLLSSADGQAVFVFDAGDRAGGDYAICVYSEGRLIVSLRLECFLGDEDMQQVMRCRCMKNHRFWRHLFRMSVHGQDLVLTRVDGSRVIRIDGSNGEITHYDPRATVLPSEQVGELRRAGREFAREVR